MTKPASKSGELLDTQNVKVIAQMIADAQTTEHLRVLLINKLLESKGDDNFFPTMFEEKMSFGACPDCGHENHWLIPESDLNKLGWLTSEEDDKVPIQTNADLCSQWAEACIKKKVSV